MTTPPTPPPNPRVLRVTHTFSFPPGRVFDAWLDVSKARKFFFATAGGEVVRAEIDARVGGEFVIVDRRNGQDFTHSGRYLEIDRPRRITFEFAVNGSPYTTVTIDIVAAVGGCELTLSHEGVWEEYRERSANGWKTILTRSEQLV